MKDLMSKEVGGTQKTADRRSFLKGAGVAGLALASTALLEAPSAMAQSSTSATSFTATDIAVLNFALNLEYLEAEFYTRSFYGVTLEEFGIPVTGTGKQGPTTGGKRVMFEENEGREVLEVSGRLRAITKEITMDEQTHVRLLRNLLGSQAIAKPAINLDAMGMGFANFKQFLNLARDFEDVGVSAYGGAVGLLSAAALSYAARIALIEAYHASNLRLLCAENKVQSFPVDGLDVPPPPVGSKYFETDNQALAIVRTTSQVLAIVYANTTPGTSSGGFFPLGVNGSITTI
jgi:hypothetical protein